MNILNCVLSYNRADYLLNCVKSTQEIFKYGDTIIVDDNSTDVSTITALKKLEESIPVLRPSKDLSYGKTKHGHMYYNMDAALKYAIENNYTYIQFIQDDCQFVWHDELFEEKVTNIYNNEPNTSMVENLFFNINGKENIPNETRVFKKTLTGNRNKRGYLDIGIWKVSILKSTRFSFGNGNEKSNSLWWRKEGFVSHRLLTPSQCHVPEPPTFRYQELAYNSNTKSKKPFLMKILNSSQIKSLNDNALIEFPYCENYCKPWGWECKSPYTLTPENEEIYERADFTRKNKYLINLSLFLIRGKLKKFILTILSYDTYIK